VKTVVVISSRGFGVLRHDLLADPGAFRFVGIFSERDVANVSAADREHFHRIHTVPCALADPLAIETSMIDVAAAREILRDLVAETGPGELTVHCYDERNLLVAAELREEFALPGPTRAQILPYRDKCLMKERLAGTGLRVPRFGRFDDAAFRDDPAGCFEAIVARVGLPFVLKPVDANSADGVHKVFSAEQFAALPGGLARGYDYEYEEYVEGTMYSVNLLSQGGRTVFGGVTEYLVNSTEVQNGRVNADINLIDTDPRVPRMIAFAETALDALGRLDGATHLELFETASDELVFLEVGARFKGLAGLAAMQRNYGVALLNTALEIEAGVPSLPWDEEQVYCFDGVVPKRFGVVADLVEPRLASEYSITWKLEVGEEIGRGASLMDNGGLFLVWNKDYEALYGDFKRLADYQPVRYRD